ncbi:MAG TPA: helix-turn-helix domain-containing protein, partial [Methanocella sp.]|nr:helix-turn-helix domain-containing protein [Methanocella sp.]
EDLEGISPKTLADALKELQAERLVGRESFNEIPPRVEYFLTEDGKTLREAVVPLLEWTVRRDSGNEGRCAHSCKGPSDAKKVRRKSETRPSWRA